MELRHLRYFIAVAEELHFGRAAERLNISGPTLSNQIHSLESTLRVQLFSRKTKRGVTLTHAGARFLQEARATVRQAEVAELVGRQAGSGHAGTVTIGYALTIALAGVLPTAIAGFRKLHPNVVYELRRTETFPTMKDILSGQTDIGLTRSPERYPSGLTGFAICDDDFYVALAEDHPLTRSRRLSAAMLSNEAFIATPLELEVGFLNNPTGSASVVARSADIISVLALVAAGCGISVVPAAAHRAGVPGVVFRKMEGSQRKAGYALIHRQAEASPLITRFIKFMRERCNSGAVSPDQAVSVAFS